MKLEDTEMANLHQAQYLFTMHECTIAGISSQFVCVLLYITSTTLL